MTPQVAVIFISKLAYIVYYRDCQSAKYTNGPRGRKRFVDMILMAYL